MRTNSSGSRLAPPTRAPSTSGWAMMAATLERLDRAAVEDPDAVGQVRRSTARRAGCGSPRRPPGRPRGSPPRRCRWPTPARTRRRSCGRGPPASPSRAPSSWARRWATCVAGLPDRQALPDAEDRDVSPLRKAAATLARTTALVLVRGTAVARCARPRRRCSPAWRAWPRRPRRCRRPSRAPTGPARRSAIDRSSPSTRVCTERRSVKGGRTATSAPAKSRRRGRTPASARSAMASRWLRFIFQLPP